MEVFNPHHKKHKGSSFQPVLGRFEKTSAKPTPRRHLRSFPNHTKVFGTKNLCPHVTGCGWAPWEHLLVPRRIPGDNNLCNSIRKAATSPDEALKPQLLLLMQHLKGSAVPLTQHSTREASARGWAQKEGASLLPPPCPPPAASPFSASNPCQNSPVPLLPSLPLPRHPSCPPLTTCSRRGAPMCSKSISLDTAARQRPSWRGAGVSVPWLRPLKGFCRPSRPKPPPGFALSPPWGQGWAGSWCLTLPHSADRARCYRNTRRGLGREHRGVQHSPTAAVSRCSQCRNADFSKRLQLGAFRTFVFSINTENLPKLKTLFA